MTSIKTTLIASAAVLMPAAAFAAPVIGLTGDKTLVMFDTTNPAVTKSMDVTGVDALAGIDWRPGNKTLIGVTPDSTIVSIDPATGAATEIAKMNTPLAMGGAQVVVDINPMADRLRYMTGTTNHRVHPDTGETTVDGALAYEQGDMHAGEAPNIVAASYINAYGKPEATAMYNIDATIGALVQQTKPNDGTLKAIGKLGIADPGAEYAFDVETTADGTNTAWLATGGKLYTVDLETGAATAAGDITGVETGIRDIAVLPAM
jgi:sugar lactone lactonase YvrE